MKKEVLTMMGAAALWAVAGSAHANTRTLLVAHVPFAFTADGNTFPAGTYEIAQADTLDPDVLVIRGENNGKVAIVDAVARTEARANGGDKLVFDKDGSQRVLSRIGLGADDGYALPDELRSHAGIKTRKRS